MTPYLRKDSRIWRVTLVDRDGKAHRLTTGTRDKYTAEGMDLMLRSLGRRGQRDWGLVEAVLARKLHLAALYDAYQCGELEKVREEMRDVDLSAYLWMWRAAAKQNLAEPTLRDYVRRVERAFPMRTPLMRSSLTRRRLKELLAAVPGTGSNVRRYASAWSSFLDFLVEHELLERNPLADLTLPKENKPSELYVADVSTLVRLLEAQEEPYRSLHAFMEGAGVEIAAALRTRYRDIISFEERTIRARGTKNPWRDRPVQVDEWAWRYVSEYLRGNNLWFPDAYLWPAHAGTAERKHRAAVLRVNEREELIPAGYTQHGARHSFAVRHIRAGASEWWVANQLGHKDTTMVRTLYGKFRPTVADVQRSTPLPDERRAGSDCRRP